MADVLHFVGKDLRIGTVCVSAKSGQGVTHVLVRTVLKFGNIDIPDSLQSSTEFEHYRTLYPKKSDIYAILHMALQHCLESIPEIDVKRHQVIRRQSAGDHSVIVQDEPEWMKSPRYISNVVKCLEEIKQEGFTHVLKNLEAQMKPGALTVDIVIPELAGQEQEKFWTFFNGLGDHVEEETYLPQAPRARLNLPEMIVGNKTDDHRMEAVAELIQTEKKYNERMQDLVHIYLAEAKASATSLNPALGKYEIRVIFSNIEQILAVSSVFLKDLQEYEGDPSLSMNLGDICARNLQRMGCYKQYLMRYKRAQDTYTTLSRKLPAFKALLERCVQINNINTLNNLLVEPTQRIVKYPLLFKGILSGTKKDSPEVEGIVEATELASQIAHMEKAKPEQTVEILFNLRNTIENCPDTLVSQNRNIVSYLDGYETNLLTGERSKSITLILFSDKVMIVRRPKGVSGEKLFQLKEDIEERKRREKEEKERKEREKKMKKDLAKKDEKGNEDNSRSAPNSATPASLGSGAMAVVMLMLRKDWKFMGWMDILKLKVAIVEQTDPEGLFCITTRNHTETKDDRWETTRGVLPEFLDKRDAFISKFHETLSLKKAAALNYGADHTSRLHVAELELFCNVFSESQYRDFKTKGDVALFYAHGRSRPIDVTPFTRLPTFVGMIQATDSGLRAMLRSKSSLNDVGDPALTTEDANRFMDVDSFQIHITELVANLQWVAYHFDPYESAQLHFSRVYLDSDYLYQTATPFLKATTLRTKGLKKIRDTTASVTSSTFSARSSPVQSPYASAAAAGAALAEGGGGCHHPSQYLYRNGGGSFSPLTSPSGILASPSSPGGGGDGLLGRCYGNNSSSVATLNYGSTSSFSGYHNNNINNAGGYGNGNGGGGGGGGGGMAMAVGSVKNSSLVASSYMMQHQHQHQQQQQQQQQYLRKRADSIATIDSTDSEQHQHQPPLYPNQQLSVSTMRNSLSVMNLLLPGPGRKKGLLKSMVFVVDLRLLDDLSMADQRTIQKLFNLVHHSEIELMRLELQNYSSAVALAILRFYLQETYDHRPLVRRTSVMASFGMFLEDQLLLQVDEQEILQRCHDFLNAMDPKSRAILGVILAFYIRVQAHPVFEEHTELLADKFSSLIFSPEKPPPATMVRAEAINHDGYIEETGSIPPQMSDDDLLWIVEVLTILYSYLWPNDSSTRSAESVSSTASITTDASTLSGCQTVGGQRHQSLKAPVDYQRLDKRVFATWSGEPPMVLKKAMGERDGAFNEALGRQETMERLRLQIQELRSAVSEEYNRMKAEVNCGQEWRAQGEGSADDQGLSQEKLGQQLNDLSQPTESESTMPAAPLTDTDDGGNNKDRVRKRSLSLGALFEGGYLDTRITSARHHPCLRTTRSQPVLGMRDDRLLLLTPVQREQIRMNNAICSATCQDEGVAVGDMLGKQLDLHVEEYQDDEDKAVQYQHSDQHGSSTTALENEIDDGGYPSATSIDTTPQQYVQTTTLLPPPFQPQQQHQQQQEDIYRIADRHLELLDRCIGAVEAQRDDVAGKLEGMVDRYEELVQVFTLATEYQMKLEYENEAIKGLYEEVTEENNVMLERFNEELEGIFETVNSKAVVTHPVEMSVDNDLTPGVMVQTSEKELSPLPPLSLSSPREREQEEQRQSASLKGSPRSPPLPPLPTEAKLSESRTITGAGNTKGGWDGSTEDQLRRLLHKAVQDRALAEQQARRAMLQANYFRDLLERHGIQP
ncbi:hypothetical protein BGX29_006031 [Mortierella sp. GBA35]|nr:hypothetical protein BGX29_006031 [Mortierella sp. GBA35]